MNTAKRTRGSEAGFVLVLALGLLIILAALGTAWLRYTVLENEETNFNVRNLRARYAAQAGIEAAVGELASSLEAGTAAKFIADGEKTYAVRVYSDIAANGEPAERAEMGRATVTIVDECGKVNLNHAPVRVLRRLLGSGGPAREVRQSVPETAAAMEDPDRLWFTDVQELVSRRILDLQTFSDLELADKLTVHSVPDPANPVAYLNVNSAPQAVIEAALDVDSATAQRIIEARPFANLTELTQAVGKDASAFNVAAGNEICFASRCFRIVSEGGVFRETPGGQRGVSRRAEAVVYFHEDGKPEIRFWSEARKLDS